jgi:hypothetical protein
LHYLAEAHFASMPVEHLAEPARQALAELDPDFFHAQQYLDLLGNRRFRNSLLVGAAPASRELHPAVIPECAISLHMRPAEARIDLSPGVPLRLIGRHNLQLSVSEPWQRAFFAALCEAAPARMPFPAAFARASEILSRVGQAQGVDSGPLSVGIARLFAIDQCDLLLLGAGEWLRPSAESEPSALMRHQAKTGLHVANRWHETVDLSAEDRAWVAGEKHSPREAALIRTGLAV